MIDKYEIKKINGEDQLILYFNFNYEFGLLGKTRTKSIKQTIKDYLSKNKINYKGTIISIVVGGVLIGNLILNRPIVNNNYEYKPDVIEVDKFLYVPNIIETSEFDEVVEIPNGISNTNNDEKAEVKSNTNVTNKSTTNKSKSEVSNNSNINNNSSNININTNTNSSSTDNSNVTENVTKEDVVDNNIYVTLKRRSGEIQKIELEEYVVGVVGAEMPALFHEEALKSQAIIARTYALKMVANGKTLTDTESTQSYKSVSELKSLWGSNFNTYYTKIKGCVDTTKGMYLTYNGNYIEAVYHSTSNGKTENSNNVWGNYFPYLVSVDSPYDSLNPSFLASKEISYSEISTKLGIEVNSNTNFEILDLTEGNRVKTIKVGDNIYRGVDFRNMFGLRSADFTIEKMETSVKITTKGYGHGVGLSQYGANGMAKNGANYVDILKHYYTGVTISKK